MRLILLAAFSLTAAIPAAAQAPASPGDKIAAMAPALDRATGAMLDLDVGPIIDAADPYRRDRYLRRHRTLRDIARRDDPYFEHRLRAQIYGTTAGMARIADAIAAAEPAMRRSLREMEREIDAAVRDARPGLPPGQVDDDWDRDFDDEGPDDEPYED
jgi:hypothetical protein